MIENTVKAEAGWKLDNSYTRLPELFFSKINPTPVAAPVLVAFNSALAASLGLDAKALQSHEGAEIFGGNQMPEGALPIAQAYAGHQFGYFTMLGDGRAVLLGEQLTPKGERFDIQLKGSGRTPYSRGGDGRAALGPMLREYIISEAMQALGIPTTRSLAVAATGDVVVRDTLQPGAVLTRVAASHLRVGTFQYAARWGTAEELRELADYALERHYPGAEAGQNPYLFLLKEVIRRQAELIAQWQLTGFVHGVMNTDNVSISGETIDYGPCAFMDAYDPETVFSSIDTEGRYAYGNQPKLALWNLARFAETLLPLLHDAQEQAVKLAEEALSDFDVLFHRRWLAGMRAKLGIFNKETGDVALAEGLLSLMHKAAADYTNTFLDLTFEKQSQAGLFEREDFAEWLRQWQARLDRQPESKSESLLLMRSSNPAVIPRNHRVEEALEAAVKHQDYSVMERLLKVLSDPYAHTPEQQEYAAPETPSGCPYKTFCGT